MVKGRSSELSGRMKKLGVDMIQVNTEEPFHIPLNKFFSLREKRMVR
jgi:hypothetical protein